MAIGMDADGLPDILDGQPILLPASGDSLPLLSFDTGKSEAIVNDLEDHLVAVGRFILADVPAAERQSLRLPRSRYDQSRRFLAKVTGPMLVPDGLSTGVLNGICVEAVDPESDIRPSTLRQLPKRLVEGIPGEKSGSVTTTIAHFVVSAFFTSGYNKRRTTASLLVARAVRASDSPVQRQYTTIHFSGLSIPPSIVPESLSATRLREEQGISAFPGYKLGNQRTGMPRSGPHRR